ncbi:hypothetical protein [Streptomyces endophytica]|uniref:Uncharacterized protein n=1 Tax=Streptomyces endophytica TaxID=2991496 RepID=A0ABY6PAS2_9ACTN|nr:hypothetical protein [Streptomyces endophytica]UZJ30904.1 hypothetical protein OJ254_11795 [Streptomyces endophytica]
MSRPLPTTTRLLPWTTPEGKTCILVSDGGPQGGFSFLADRFEAVQLEMALGLIEHAADLLADSEVTDQELRFLCCQLRATLVDVHRVAVSRGERLAGDNETAGE